MVRDSSNGYEAVAAVFANRREASTIGLETALRWARGLPARGAVLDLGCGSGAPIAVALASEGFELFGVDASPSLMAAFRARLPRAAAVCEAVEDSRFFGRTFDGVLAIGLVFLLPEAAQRDLIRRLARALSPEGRFLFSAPQQACTWSDVLTGRVSVSLGAAGYAALFDEARLVCVATHEDEGGNHYFEVQRK